MFCIVHKFNYIIQGVEATESLGVYHCVADPSQVWLHVLIRYVYLAKSNPTMTLQDLRYTPVAHASSYTVNQLPISCGAAPE